MAIPCIDTYDNIRFKVIADRKQLFINDRLNKLWYIHPIESYPAKKRKQFPYSLHTDIQWRGKRPEQSLCIVCHLCKKPMHTWLGTESC